MPSPKELDGAEPEPLAGPVHVEAAARLAGRKNGIATRSQWIHVLALLRYCSRRNSVLDAAELPRFTVLSR
jgi:hypothetical protein